MDPKDLSPRADDVEESPAPANDPVLEAVGAHLEAELLPGRTNLPRRGVDDLNPALGLPHDLPNLMRPNRPRNPSGMLMGPNDPFFEEVPRQLRAPGSTAPRYDAIGPFGREPDPSIDPSLHPWSPTANRGGMMGRGPGPFPGPGGPFF